MYWTRKLPAPITLTDGRSPTLADACELIQSLPLHHQRAEHWQYAGGSPAEAAVSRAALRTTDMQLQIALMAEGLV